jgi:hypothetical protein
MKKRKAELRRVVLDIIAGRESTKYEVLELGNLKAGVAEVLHRRTGKSAEDHALYPRDPQLEDEDKLLIQEIFWDLILERIVTPGWDVPNGDLPYFRIHSEAKDQPKKLK